MYLLLTMHWDNTRTGSLASLVIYSTLKIPQILGLHSKGHRGNQLAELIPETLLNRGDPSSCTEFLEAALGTTK